MHGNHSALVRMPRRSFLALVGLGAASLALEACAAGSSPTGAATSRPTGTPGSGSAKLDAAREAGIINVGYAVEPPYSFLEDGELVGFNPDLARVVFQNLGVAEINGIQADYPGLIPGLQTGRVAMIAHSLSINPERCEALIFSEPFYCLTGSAAVAPGNPHGITRLEDLISNRELRVAGYTSGVLTEHLKSEGVALIDFPDVPTAMEAIGAGRLDAAPGPAVTLNYLKSDVGYEVDLIPPYPYPGGRASCGAFSFAPGDESLRDLVNEELARLTADGTVAEIGTQYTFDKVGLDQATQHTAEELCNL